MPDWKLFAKAFFGHWWAYMSCAAFTILGIVLLFAPSDKTGAWTIRSTAGLALIFFTGAAYRAWLDEHRKFVLEREKVRDLEEKTGRPALILSYSKPEPREPEFKDGVMTFYWRESEFLIRNSSPDQDAFEIGLYEFKLGGFVVVGRPLDQLQAGATARISYSVGVYAEEGMLNASLEYEHNILLLLDKEFESRLATGDLEASQIMSLPVVISYKNADGFRFETNFELQHFLGAKLLPRFILLASRKAPE